ncbi:MAG TPA: hypothetical protein VKT82_01655 [Ktedonobacterales bacterium]|nr:hypothetical protein [Ktedonobacterales bacterium]
MSESEMIRFLRNSRTLLLELLQNPPAANDGWGDECFYCRRAIWGQMVYQEDYDFAPQNHKPGCLIARIGHLFPEERKGAPGFPPHTWQSGEPFTLLLRDFANGAERYIIRCNKCQVEHTLPQMRDEFPDDTEFRKRHYQICHAALREAQEETRAAEKRAWNPPCPACGKPSSKGQLARRGFCRRCELEKRELIQSWVAFFEQVFELPPPAWQAFGESKGEP